MRVYFIRTCSKSTEKVSAIYRILEMKEALFVRKKSVVHKSKLKKKIRSWFTGRYGVMAAMWVRRQIITANSQYGNQFVELCGGCLSFVCRWENSENCKEINVSL